MNKNKYLVFISIGFELITLIIIALWLGNYLSNNGFGTAAQAFCVLAAFLLWFISLIFKLKKIKND